MRKKNLFKIIPQIFSVIFLAVMAVSCTADDATDPCGIDGLVSKSWEFNLGTILDDFRFYPAENVVAYDFITETAELVCPHEHIKAHFFVSVNESNRHLINLNADVTYSFFHTYPLTGWESLGLTGEWNLLHGKANFGISHVYGDEAGWFFPYLKISFTDKGSDESNDTWFVNNVKFVEFECDYKYIK